MTPPSPSALDFLDGASGSRLRLARRRLGLRRQRLRAAAGREGVPRRPDRVPAGASTDDDMPRSTWDLRRYFWAPRLGMKGIFRLTRVPRRRGGLRRGLGGGSLGYANTLYRAPERFYADPQWSGLEDWGAALAPHYDTAERMLGVVTVEADDPADQLLREFGARDRRRQDVRQDARRRLLRHARRDRRRPVLRRRRARRAPAASRAAAAWSAARTTPRTRCPRTTCGSPSARAPRSRPSARWSTSSRSARPTARTATRSPPSAPAPGCAATGACTPRAASSSRRARSGPTGCSPAPSCRARSRASPTASASWCGRTRRRSSPSRSPRAART